MTITCRICGNPQTKILFYCNGWEIVQCDNCNLIQLGRQPTEAELASIYSDKYFKSSKYELNRSALDQVALDRAAKLEQQRRLAWLERAGVKPRGKILDVGCATGDFVIAATDRYEVWGLDVSDYAIREARNRCSLPYDRLQAGSLYAIPFGDRMFDAIVLWDVLEHLGDPAAAMEQIKRSLKIGGVFVCSTPNIGAWTAKIMKKRWAFMTPPEHICFYDRVTLERLLREYRFELQAWMTRGKHVNLGFLMYKLRRVFPELIPESLVKRLGRTRFGEVVLYAPTGDIQYVIARLLPQKD